MKTGFIGAGKAGTSLGIYFRNRGLPVSGYYSKSKDSSIQAADLTGSAAFSDLETLIKECDMIFITTPDRNIGETAKRIAGLGSRGKYVCHLSGSLPSDVLACASDRYASSHPMTAISSRQTDLSESFFTLEGEAETVAVLEEIFRSCGNRTARIRTEKKGLYHCAGSVASNLVVGLAAMAMDMLADCGFDRDSAGKLLAPLMKNNMEAICRKGPAAALTGPLERGDTETVARHMECLDGRQREIYRLLSQELISTAAEKNQDRDYSEMQKLLEEKK